MALNVTPGRADDTPVAGSGKVPAPAISNAWSGFHLGANGAYGWGDVNTSNGSLTTTGPLVGVGLNSFPSTTFPGGERHFDLKGGAAGVQAGYDWQAGPVVLGIEADFQGGDIRGKDAFLGSAAGPAYSSTTHIYWFGTARARLGYAYGRWLPYITGGFAYGGMKSNLEIQPGSLAVPRGPAFKKSVSKTGIGYAAGAGVELALSQDWTVKAEYLHIDLGTNTFIYDFGASGSTRSDAHARFNVVRVGFDFRF
jgi:outer membrane immunogenic protein